MIELTIDQRNMINAALRGHREPMDRAELIALSLMVYPHHRDGRWYEVENATDDLVLWPMKIERAAGPRCETRVMWSLVRPCGRCWRRVHRDDCIRCGGRGHLSDEWESEVYTDIDGLVIMDGYGSDI